MSRILLAAVLIAGLGAASWPEPADAAQTTRAKAKRSADAQPQTRRVASASRTGNEREPIPGLVGLRDRSTIYHANGRINGREFFERLQEQTGGGGQ